MSSRGGGEEAAEDAPNFLVPRLPGTQIFAGVGGVLLLLMLVAIGLRLARGEPLLAIDTDAHTDMPARSSTGP